MTHQIYPHKCQCIVCCAGPLFAARQALRSCAAGSNERLHTCGTHGGDYSDRRLPCGAGVTVLPTNGNCRVKAWPPKEKRLKKLQSHLPHRGPVSSQVRNFRNSTFGPPRFMVSAVRVSQYCSFQDKGESIGRIAGADVERCLWPDKDCKRNTKMKLRPSLN